MDAHTLHLVISLRLKTTTRRDLKAVSFDIEGICVEEQRGFRQIHQWDHETTLKLSTIIFRNRKRFCQNLRPVAPDQIEVSGDCMFLLSTRKKKRIFFLKKIVKKIVDAEICVFITYITVQIVASPKRNDLVWLYLVGRGWRGLRVVLNAFYSFICGRTNDCERRRWNRASITNYFAFPTIHHTL